MDSSLNQRSSRRQRPSQQGLAFLGAFARSKPQRGIAALEALLAILLLFIVIQAFLFLSRSFRKESEERSTIRYCLWRAAYEGCGDTAEQCPAFESAPSAERQSAQSTEPLSPSEAEALDEGKPDDSAAMGNEMEKATAGFKRRISLESTVVSPLPSLLQSDDAEQRSRSFRLSLPCNPSPDQFNISPQGAFRDYQ